MTCAHATVTGGGGGRMGGGKAASPRSHKAKAKPAAEAEGHAAPRKRRSAPAAGELGAVQRGFERLRTAEPAV